MAQADEADRTIALALRGLEVAGGPRAALERVRALGFAAVQLDAAAPGVRPRDLSRSARRGLAALLRRLELVVAGVDLFIPPEHLLDPMRADRAAAALAHGAQFAADIAALAGGVPTLCCALPAEGAAEALEFVASSAGRAGARVADFAWTSASAFDHLPPNIGAGIDPGAVLRRGKDPAGIVGAVGDRLAAARLSDDDDGARVAPGHGALDVRAYRGALSAVGFAGAVALDLRSVREQEEAARTARAVWRGAAP